MSDHETKEKTILRPSAAEKWLMILIGVVTFVCYTLTLAPDLTWSHWGADGGDFITAIYTRTLPHPPGFPLYLMLGRLMTFVPFGAVPWRMNLLSAMMAAGAVSLTAMTLREKGLPLWAAAAASLSLGFAPLFWSQALITEVYTSAAFFVSLTHYFITTADKYDRSVIVPGITWGMAMAIHPTTAITALYFWSGRKRLWDGIIAGVVTAFICYTTLFLWGAEPQRWADTSTIRGWLAYASGQLYWNYAFSLPAFYIPRRLISFLALCVRQYTAIGAVFVIFGTYKAWQLSRKTTLGLLLCGGMLALYAITYDSFDSFIYIVPILPLFTEFLGRGMDWFLSGRVPGVVLLLIPLFLMVMHWQNISLQADRTVALWLDDVLSQMPEGGVALTYEDSHTFTLWYAQEVAGMREDIVVLDTRLWEFQPYRRTLANSVHMSPLDYNVLGTTRILCEVNNRGAVCH